MKIRKKASRTRPSIRLITFTVPPSNKMSLAKKANTNEDKITRGISLLIVPSPTFIGKTNAVQPIIIRILKILLPTTLPIAISALPLIDDSRLITNSGADVPKATIVSPITKSEIRNFFATAAEPSVSALAPTRISANPPIK